MALLPDSIGSSGGGGGVLPDWLLQALAGAQAAPQQGGGYNPIVSDFSQFPNAQQPPQTLMDFYKQQAQAQAQPPPLPPPSAVAPAPQPPPQAAMAQAPVPQAPSAAAGPMPQFPLPQIGGNNPLGRLGAGFMGFANSRSPMGALGNLFGGLATGQRLDPQGVEAQTMRSTYQAAKQAGAPDALAMMMATNPQAAQSLMPKIMEAGTDPLTQEKSFVKFNPLTGGMTNVTAQAGSPTPSGLNETMTKLQQAKAAGATPEQLLDLIPSGYRDDVKAMIEKRSVPANLGRSNLRPVLIHLAHAVDDNFNETELPAQVAAFKAWTTGKDAETVRNLRQTLYHGSEELLKAFDNLKNTQYPAANALGNVINTNILGKPGVQDFMMNSHAFASELSKIYKQANLSDAEVNAWASSLGPNMSPDQQKAVMLKAVGLLEGGLKGLQQKRLEAVGAKEDAKMPPIVGPEQIQLIERMRNWVPGSTLPTAPAAPPAGGSTGGWTVNRVR